MRVSAPLGSFRMIMTRLVSQILTGSSTDSLHGVSLYQAGDESRPHRRVSAAGRDHEGARAPCQCDDGRVGPEIISDCEDGPGYIEPAGAQRQGGRP